MKQHEYYSVAVGRSTMMDYSPAPDFTCGHKHRSTETAEKCQGKFLGYHKDPAGGGQICSAKWYNSYIVGQENGKWVKIN